jgi:uncharacterized protein (TIGR02217 family)
MSTIITDETPVFPKCPGYGFKVDPFILVKIIEREGGFERVDRKWSQARRQFDGVPTPDANLGDIEDILYFWLAIGGMAGTFRFRDYTDYKSCRTYQSPAPGDQPLVANSNSPGGYLLIKQYAVGPFSLERRIFRPRGDTIIIANEVNAPQTDWTLDESTGVLSIGGAFVGTPTSWAGEFDVWCRFNASFQPEITNKEILTADVSVIEKRERES